MSPDRRSLAERVHGVRRTLLRRLAGTAALASCALGAVVLALAWVGAGAEGWRPGSRAPLVLDLALLAAVVAVVQGARRAAARSLAPERVARTMEEAAALPAGAVRGALELTAAVPPGVSRGLAAKAAADAAAQLPPGDAGLGGALGAALSSWRRWAGVASVSAGAVVALMAAASPPRAAAAWSGLLAPVEVAGRPALAPLVLTPGTVEVPRGSPVDVRISAPGRTVVYLEWQAAGDVPVVDTLEVRDGTAGRRFAGVSAPVEYGARAVDGALTPRHRLVPVDPLFLSDLAVRVAFPPHTGLPPVVHRGGVPLLEVPQGTRLVVEGATSRPLAEASLVDASGAAATVFNPREGGFEGAWTPAASGTYGWRLRTPSGDEPVPGPDPLEVRLVPDAPPRVAIPLPGADTLLPLDLVQPLVLEARDDYGLRRLEVVAYRVTPLTGAGDPVVHGVDVGGARAVLARPILDLSSWDLLPGDEVRYFARALDNGPRGGWGRSPEFVLRVPAVAALGREAESRLTEAARRMDEAAAEAERQARESRDLGRRLEGEAARAGERRTAPGSPGASELPRRDEIRRALEGHAALAGALDSLGSELGALARALEAAAAADPGLAADLAELRGILADLAGADLAQRAGEVARSLEEGRAGDAQRSLEALASEQDAFRRRLEASLERFRRAALDQDFRATREEADELARAQSALADALREGDRPELRRAQQEGLAAEADSLGLRLRRLEARLEDVGEARSAERVAQAREAAGDGADRMGRAAEEAAQGRSGEAASTADQAAARLDEAGRRLQEAEEALAGERSEQAVRALLAAADGALALARRQTALASTMDGAAAQVLAALRGDVAALSQGVRNVVGALQEAGVGAHPQAPAVAARAGQALEALQHVVQALERPGPGAAGPQAAAARAVAALNGLALAALTGADAEVGQGGEGEGGGDTQGQMQEMAQRQGSVVNQAGELAPLQLGADAMGEQLGRLAAEQEAVARGLEELAQGEPRGKEALGDLEAFAAEARALAEAMAAGRLEPETVRRQERLFHRLLDAGRGLRGEAPQETQDRESRAAGAFRPRDVLPLRGGIGGAFPILRPTPAEMQTLPPALRTLVIEYFDRLNRRGGG